MDRATGRENGLQSILVRCRQNGVQFLSHLPLRLNGLVQWGRHLVTSITGRHTDNHTDSSEMGSLTPWSLTACSSLWPREDDCQLLLWVGSGWWAEQLPGRWRGGGLAPPGGSLGDPTQSQHIKANVANSHRLVQIKLYNGNLLGRAFMAQQTPAVTTVMFASCDSKLGSALVAVGAVTPRRLLGQHI